MPGKFYAAFAITLPVLLLATSVLSSGAAPAKTYKMIYSFQAGSDGALPVSDLVADAAGNLYGTTSSGGGGARCANGCGTVFELNRTSDGWKEEVLYRFSNDGDSKDAAVPQAGLVIDKEGNLYGTSTGGGRYFYGTVFELSRNSHGAWSERVLYNFTGGADGATPETKLTIDANRNIYGTASGGGKVGEDCWYGCGTVFELSPRPDGSWTETTIYAFQANSSDGKVPSSVLIFDSSGDLYGTTTYGGTGRWCAVPQLGFTGCGAIYKLSPGMGGSWTESVLYSFARGRASGIYPTGGLVLDTTGYLYGTTTGGGDGLGTIFQVHESKDGGWERNNLHLFSGPPSDGWTRPFTIPSGGWGRMVISDQGGLRGVVPNGGAFSLGIVFELKRAQEGWRETIPHSFGSGSDGSGPYDSLLVLNGRLYGTTTYGGTGDCRNPPGCGTVYEVIP